jgi:hypothetical protein
MPEKIYHSRTPHLRIVVADAPGVARSVVFAGDTLLTSDPAVIEHLDGICDKPGSPVYSKQPVEDSAGEAAKSEALRSAQRAFDKVVAAGEAVRA